MRDGEETASADHGMPEREEKENVENEEETVGLVGGSQPPSASRRESATTLRLTMLGVFCGLCCGLLLYNVLPDDPSARERVSKVVGLPGRLFMNLLKQMVLPMVSSSMVAGVCSLQSAGANTGKLARVTLAWFAGSTSLAILLGMLIVGIVQPGRVRRD